MDFERKRLENLRDNANFLAKLGMTAAKADFVQAVSSAKKAPSTKGYKEK